jgi:long-chain acyl-CoA synthetase
MQALDLAVLGHASPDDPAVLRADGGAVRYGQLLRLVSAGQRLLECPAKALVAVDAPRTLTGVVAYLAAIRSGHAVVLVENGSADLWADLIAAYRPELLVTQPGSDVARLAERRRFRAPASGALPVWRQVDGSCGSAGTINPDLAMLIRTSGSLGHPKTVRLSYGNLRANAVAIAEALRIRPADRALASLPLDFSFGLSILNSHLAAGAATGLTCAASSSEELWWCADQMRATCVGAVPVTYQFLRASRWEPRDHPSLRRLLHAGGALDKTSLLHFARLMSRAGGDLVTMYGQTEATARIAYLPPELLTEHLGSVGVAIPGGRMRIERADGAEAIDGEVGEVVYEGPNVMMGYALARADLGAGDSQHGILRTGDLGSLRGGFLYLAGRADRQVKVLGRRVDLEQVELHLADCGVTAAVTADTHERVLVVVEKSAERRAAVQCRAIAARLGFPPGLMTVIPTDVIPRTPHGKIDYMALSHALEQRISEFVLPPSLTRGHHENQPAVLRQS